MTDADARPGKFILIVEDDPGVMELEAERLAPLGLEIRRARSAAEALAALKAGAPEMMLLDYSLPDGSALDLVRAAGAQVQEPPPFIVATGRGDEAVAVESMKAGAADYIVKDSGFLERLRTVVQRGIDASRLRRQLRENEERFRKVFEVSNAAKSITMPDGAVTPNGALCALLGYSREELARKNWRELTPPEDVPAVEKILGKLTSGETESARFEKRYLRRDGGVVLCDVSVTAKRDAAGRLEYFIATLVDITERAALAARLREQEELFHDLYEKAPLGYQSLDEDGNFLEVNEAWLETLGYAKAEVVGRWFGDFLAPEYVDAFRERFPKFKAAGRVHSEFEMLHKDGSRRYVAFDGRVARNAAGEFQRTHGIMKDITEAKRAEALLAGSEAKFRSLVEAMPDIVMRFDRECRHLYASPNVEAVAGLKPEAFIGRTHAELGFPPELCLLLENRIKESFASGQPAETEFTYGDGAAARHFNWRLLPEKDEAGQVGSLLTIARDITDLKRLEADYKNLFDSMLDGFALHEMIFGADGRPSDYRFLSINPAFEAQTGLKAETTVGRLVSDIMPEQYREWVEIYGRVAVTGEPARFERFSAQLGRYYDVLAFRPRPGQFACIFKDITSRKADEEKMRRQAALLEMAGAMARFGAWSVDLAANTCSWSDEVAAIHERPAGYSPKVEEGISYYAPEYREKIKEVFTACAREGLPYDEEMEIVTASGNRRWVRTMGRAERDGAGAVVRVVGSFQDITERKTAEMGLRESEARFRALFENHSAVKLIVDPETHLLVDANPAAAKFYGWPREKMVGMSIDDINTLPHASIADSMAEVSTGKKVWFEFKHRLADGSLRDVEVFSSRFAIGGKPLLHSIVHDITERKRMEEDLVKSQKIESLGVMAGGIAHDFNNMLTGVTGNLSLLAAKNPAAADILQDALQAAHGAQALTAQLLSFSSGGKPVMKEFCLQNSLRDIFHLATRGCAAARELDIDSRLWSVDGDEQQIKQAVNNILLNGIQAMPGGGTIRLKARNVEVSADSGLPVAPGKYVDIRIADTGVGIPGEALPHIFEPYFTTKPKGHGLGLPMAWTVVKNHGGHIAADSGPGGTEFRLLLPATGLRLECQASEQTVIAKGTGRILVLEDEEIVARAAERMLAELGYTFELTTDGRQTLQRYAEEKAAGRPFAAVIMDLTMPGGMGGREAGAELRRLDPGAVIIVSSGYSDEPVMAEYKAFGFDAVLPKPYRFEELAETLTQLLGKY